ncbi:MAG: TonB-dependent receptor [Salibacteraceae bacterium]
MRHRFTLFSFVFFLLTSSVMAQQSAQENGVIRGTVYDKTMGEPLIGANVVIKGTTNGISTDLDGQFSLPIAPGNYDVEISFITFQTLTIEGVTVEAGETALLGELQLEESSMLLKEVVIQAEASRQSEEALMMMKKKSGAMVDGISASRMQLAGDANAVDAAKRVTGVTVEDGKYIYVRGLGDRYTKTMLNNVDIPGLDPDKNSLQMDIFPTNLIDNIVVSKTFSADMPADFTGGLVNIETKSFPDEKFTSVSFGLGYNPDMHFNPDYLTYNGGKTDFLGFDDGTRALPAAANRAKVPTPISANSDEEVNDFVESFNPELGTKRQMSLMDYSAGVSFGNQIDLKNSKRGGKLGYIFSLSYKKNYNFYDDVVYGEYQKLIDPDVYGLRYATVQTGQLGEESNMVGVLGGLAYKTKKSKYRLTLMRLQNGVSRAGQFFIDNDGAAVGQSGYFAGADNLEYNQRGMNNILLHGSHFLDDSGWEIDWRLSPTFSTSADPDIRKTAFTFSAVDTSFIAGAGGNPSRIWRDLSEVNATARIDLAKKYTLADRKAKLMFGGLHTFKQRDYEILFYDIQFTGSQSWESTNPQDILNPENLYPNRPNGIYYQSGNNNPNPNEYQSTVQSSALYVSNQLQITPRLNSILGLRAEKFTQWHTGRDQRAASGDLVNGRSLENEKVLDAIDLFPSVNFIYSVAEEQNLRLSYSKTIARPSFKELSFAQIIDPLTNRIFNGSLFTYTDWEGNLTETRIDNLDLRWELFMEDGQLLSASVFYKRFDDPIELVRIPEQQTSTEYQPRNVGNGQLYGVEVEFRKDLAFVSPGLKPFSLNGNLTVVESQIDMTSVEFNSRKTYEKTGETIKDTRQMAGQSPYVVNAGAAYRNVESGLDVGVFYNVKGPTLFIVGAGLFPDIYMEPFHSLEFSVNKKIGKEKRTVIDFKVSNILNDRLESFYMTYNPAGGADASETAFETKAPFSSINPGRVVSMGISHKF